MKQETGRQQPGIPFLQGGEDVKVLLKATRSQQGSYRADSYEDGAAYFALAGEAAAKARGSAP